MLAMNSRPITQRDEGGSRPGLTVREDRHVTWIKSDIRVAVAGEDNRDDEVAEVTLTNLSQGGFSTAEGHFSIPRGPFSGAKVAEPAARNLLPGSSGQPRLFVKRSPFTGASWHGSPARSSATIPPELPPS